MNTKFFKMAENVDWESCQKKFSEFLEYHASKESKKTGKNYPRYPLESTKPILSKKTKGYQKKV